MQTRPWEDPGGDQLDCDAQGGHFSVVGCVRLHLGGHMGHLHYSWVEVLCHVVQQWVDM